MQGRLISIVGPSGAGKDTLIIGAMARRPKWQLARRVITRPFEAGGEDFESIDAAGFAERLSSGAFAIHWHAHGLSYGVPVTIDDWLASGATVVFNGSRAALPDARLRYPALETVLITAPIPVLAARLAARGRESAGEIERRLARKVETVPQNARVVENTGGIDEGVARLLAALTPSAESV